jgi:hypothetical protein
MTVLSRGARVRRGGRRPGWVLLTALLVLAMGASSALVFTNRVELLKLAVILALWAAVAGAFVSVLYRRQSDADQSRVRDMKLVYDLQLDREISARREYELTVESQLRRELASEIRAQAADDLSALRTELASLRTRLEILFDTDFEARPALETMDAEPASSRAYTDWSINGESGPVDWVSSDRVTSVRQEAQPSRSSRDEASIIDVPEEPLLPPRPPAPPPRERVRVHQDVPPEATPVVHSPEPQRRFEPRYRPPPPPVSTPAPPPGPPSGPFVQAAQPQRPPPPPQPQPRSEPPPLPPQAQPQPQPAQPQPAQHWRPAATDGQWLPPGAPGSHWAGAQEPVEPVEPVEREAPSAPEPETSGRRRRARHYTPDETPDEAPEEPADATPGTDAPSHGDSGRRARSRHSTEYRDHSVGSFASRSGPPPVAPQLSEPPPQHAPSPHAAPPPPRLAPAFPPRHRTGEPEPVPDEPAPPDPLSAHSDGQSVAELMARLGSQPTEGGRRRRRDA